MAKVLTTELDGDPADGVHIRISGCPNSCGGHQIASIGFHGAVRKIGSRAAPFYNVLIGGHIDGSGAHFGKSAGKIPARRVREAIDRLVAHARTLQQAGESLEAVFERAPIEGMKAVLKDLTEIGEEQAQATDFLDFGSDAPFEVVTMEGECAA
jgi:sulfite reductase beta subunit-like hemoprotein